MCLRGSFRVSILLSALLWLTGCAVQQKDLPEHRQSVSTYSGLVICQSELAALQLYDVVSWQKQDTALNTLLDRSAKYLLTRPKLSTDMQSLLDSVYQAQLATRCQRIHVTLFDALMQQAKKEKSE